MKPVLSISAGILASFLAFAEAPGAEQMLANARMNPPKWTGSSA